MNIDNLEELAEFTEHIKAKKGYREPLAFAIGRIMKSVNGSDAYVNFAVVNYRENFATAAVLIDAIEDCGVKFDFKSSEFVVNMSEKMVKKTIKPFKFLIKEAKKGAHKNLIQFLEILEIMDVKAGKDARFKAVFLFDEMPPKSMESAHLKLYLRSLGKSEENIQSICEILPNLAWDSHGNAYDLKWLLDNEITLKMNGKYPNIVRIAKLPTFLSHILPGKCMDNGGELGVDVV